MKKISLIIFIGLLMSSCKSKSQNQSSIKQFKGFVSNKLPNAGYAMSIPADYKIIENKGPDFSVYYVLRKDSTIKSVFRATMYLGNHPAQFSVAESCKPGTIKASVLETDVQWEIYDCEDRFFTQTLVRNNHNHGWDQMVHASGRAKSKAGIDTILYIFSTLKAKE